MNLREFTNEDITEFQRQIEEKQVKTQPVISDCFPIESLQVEFEEGDPIFREKLAIFTADFDRFRRSRGDGNCFFRSFAFCFFEIFCSCDSFKEGIESLSNLFDSTLSSAGFDKIAYEDFLEEFINGLKEFHENIPVIRVVSDPSDWLASNWRDNEMRANCTIVILRMLVSAFLQAHVEEYLPFIYEFDGVNMDKSPLEIMKDFCRRHVEAMGEESDQIHTIVMTKILRCQIEIAYLDANPLSENMIMKFGDEPTANSFAWQKISLLYRPGHYDVIYRR